MRLFPPKHYFSTTEKGHDRIEKREIIAIPYGPPNAFFPYINQAFKVTRTRIIDDKNTIESVVGITSATRFRLNPQEILTLLRDHWQIENCSHYIRDVVMMEDKSRIRKLNGPRVMATLRNLAISILRLDGVNNISQAIKEILFGMKAKVIRFLGFR